MTKKINARKIDTIIPDDVFISHIDSLVGKVKNVTLEGKFSDMKVYELEDTMFVLINFADSSGEIPALLVGNRDDEFKSLVESIIMKYEYKIKGNVYLLDDVEDIDLPFIHNIKGQKVLFITALQDLNATKLFGVDIVKLYNYDLNKAYNLINDNTDYLVDIPIGEVKDIKFSSYKDIIILLNDGIVLLNGKKILDNIKMLGFMSGISIFAFSNDNIITCLTGEWNSTKFMNNNNYKYKKIIITPLVIVALTFENDIKLFGTLVDQVVDYHRFINIEDVGYVDENDDIVVIKDGKVYSLLNEYDYANEVPDVLVEGSLDDIDIIE